MKLTFELDQVQSLLAYTKALINEGADTRDGFDEPGLILASQYGSGIYLMSSLVHDENIWTPRVVFARYCNPNGADYFEKIAVAAYGTEEEAELLPLATAERIVKAALTAGTNVLELRRNSGF